MSRVENPRGTDLIPDMRAFLEIIATATGWLLLSYIRFGGDVRASVTTIFLFLSVGVHSTKKKNQLPLSSLQHDRNASGWAGFFHILWWICT